MMGSSYIPENPLPEGENAPKSGLINMLSNDISDKVVINDGSTMNYMNDVQKVPDEGYYIEKYQDGEEEEDDEEDGDDFSEEEPLAQRGYGKSEHQRQYSDDGEDEEEYDKILEESLFAQTGYLKKEPPKHEPQATPTGALKLVSALNGSREKEGKKIRECHVSWAPDVYDTPSSTEHVSTTNTLRHKNERKLKGLAGKNRQREDLNMEEGEAAAAKGIKLEEAKGL